MQEERVYWFTEDEWERAARAEAEEKCRQGLGAATFNAMTNALRIEGMTGDHAGAEVRVNRGEVAKRLVKDFTGYALEHVSIERRPQDRAFRVTALIETPPTLTLQFDQWPVRHAYCGFYYPELGIDRSSYVAE